MNEKVGGGKGDNNVRQSKSSAPEAMFLERKVDLNYVVGGVKRFCSVHVQDFLGSYSELVKQRDSQ